jgi:GNAT superfamily N-acetyltransferase
MAGMVEITALTPDRLPDLERLFATNGTVAGCWCMYFLVTGREFSAGWRAGNQAGFAELVLRETVPLGLLAYRDAEPVGWCAAGPRARYGKVLRSPLYRERDPGDDESVWIVPCFYVHRSARRTGLTRDLLNEAVALAAAHGARAVEGFPLTSDKRYASADAYVGTEAMFTACGFRVVRRPNERRLIMRRDLASNRRRKSDPGRDAPPG